MNKTSGKKKSSALIDKLIVFFGKLSNSKKKGELADMLLKDEFHNKMQTEEEYQKEQKEWLASIRDKKTGEGK